MSFKILSHLKQLYLDRRHETLLRYLHSVATIGDNFSVSPAGMICNESGDRSRIVLGNNCQLNGNITCTSEGRVEIGDYSTLQSWVNIRSISSIKIGSFTGIAYGTLITDNNTHPTDIEGWIRHRIRVAPSGPGYPGLGFGWEKSSFAPICIGNGVWIGSNCVVYKGVCIGDGAIVASNAVVTKDVEPFTLVAGNPARKVKQLVVPDESVLDIAQRILLNPFDN